LQWLGLSPGGKQDNRLVFIKVLTVVKLLLGNFGILRGNKDELRPTGSVPGLMEISLLERRAA
jgi:hypothetical protein